MYNNLQVYKLRVPKETPQISPTASNTSLSFACKNSRDVQRISTKLDIGLLYKIRQYTGILPKMKLN